MQSLLPTAGAVVSYPYVFGRYLHAMVIWWWWPVYARGGGRWAGEGGRVQDHGGERQRGV